MTLEPALSMRRSAPHRITSLAGLMAAIVALAGCAPSLAPGTRACVGFPEEVCQGRVADLEQEGQTHGGVAAYRFVCTSATCTAARGEGTETVVFGDGTGRESTGSCHRRTTRPSEPGGDPDRVVSRLSDPAYGAGGAPGKICPWIVQGPVPVTSSK
jgi:hypothetical protein